MMGDAVIVDAVVHPYDLSDANRNPQSQPQLDAVYAAHCLSVDSSHADYVLSYEEFFVEFPYDALAVAEFIESPVDFAVIHALPNLGFCLRDVTAPAAAASFRDQHPQRFGLFATVDTPIIGSAIAQLRRQVDQFAVDGLKLYPAFFYDGLGSGWRLDGEDFATPLLEAACAMGIRNIAIHKALWLPPAPRAAFAIDDLASPLARFGDLNFQMVHGGVAFLDETVRLMQAHPNLYLTLETMFSYILVKPRLFARTLATLFKAVGSDRLMFGSGNNLTHPRPLLEAFRDYQFPDDITQELALPPWSEQDRRNILGLNALRLLGRTPESVIAGVDGDLFQRARDIAAPPPWSVLRGAAQTVPA